jgi:hypothetical protein
VRSKDLVDFAAVFTGKNRGRFILANTVAFSIKVFAVTIPHDFYLKSKQEILLHLRRIKTLKKLLKTSKNK